MASKGKSTSVDFVALNAAYVVLTNMITVVEDQHAAVNAAHKRITGEVADMDLDAQTKERITSSANGLVDILNAVKNQADGIRTIMNKKLQKAKEEEDRRKAQQESANDKMAATGKKVAKR